MKKGLKVVLVISLCLVVAGIALITVSALTGGSFTGLKSKIAIRDIDNNFAGRDIKELELELGSGVLNIVRGDSYRVEARNIAEQYYTCDISDGVLRVKEEWGESSAMNIARGLNLFDYKPEITVYLPEDFSADNMKITVTAGRISADTLLARKAEITVAAGSCNIDSISVGELNMTVAAGNLAVYSMEADDLDINVAAGKAYVGGSVREKGSVDCSAGSVELQLTGKDSDYSFEIDVGAGTVSVGGSNYGGLGTSSRLDGDVGSPKIDMNCSAGGISVGFTG